MAELSGIDTARVRELETAENARFIDDRPRSMAALERAKRTMPRGVPMSWMDDLYEHPPIVVTRGEGATFTDLDGHTYVDMYVADLSAFCGHAPRRWSRRWRRGWPPATSSSFRATTRSP